MQFFKVIAIYLDLQIIKTMDALGSLEVHSANLTVIDDLERIYTEFNKLGLISDSAVINMRFNVLLKELLNLFYTHTETACEFVLETFHRCPNDSYYTKAYIYCICKLIKGDCKKGVPYFVIGYLMAIGYMPEKLSCSFLSAKSITIDWFLQKGYEFGENRCIDYIDIRKIFNMPYTSSIDEIYSRTEKLCGFLENGHYELLLAFMHYRDVLVKSLYESAEWYCRFTSKTSLKDDFVARRVPWKFDYNAKIIECIDKIEPLYLSPDTKRIISYIEHKYECFRKKYLADRIRTLTISVLLTIAYIVFCIYNVKRGMFWLPVVTTLGLGFYLAQAWGFSDGTDGLFMSTFKTIFRMFGRAFTLLIDTLTGKFKYNVLYPVPDLPGFEKLDFTDSIRQGVYKVIR